MAPSGAKSTWAWLKNTLQISPDYTVPPAGLRWRSNTLFIIATVAIGLFTDLFLYGLIVPILPYMLQDRIGVPSYQVQSLVSGLLTAYAAASVLFSPVAGVLADRVSTRQAPFLLGLSCLLLATVLLYLGASVPVLVVARVLQGVSAAVVWTIGLALCLETVGPENLGKTIGSIFSFISVGNLAAPVLGGVMYEKTGYPGVFGIGFAILAIDFIMRLLVIEKKVAARYETHDPTQGDLDTAAGDEPRQNGTTTDEENGNTEESPLLTKKEEDYYKISPNQSAIAHKVKLLPCLKDSSLLTAFLVAGVQAALLGAFDATVPTVAEEYYSFTSLKSGLLFLPLGISDLLLGPLFGWTVDRFGTKIVATAGYAYLVPVLALLRLPKPCPAQPSSILTDVSAQAACAHPAKEIAIFSTLLFLAGIGLAAIGAPSIVEAGGVVQRYHKRNPEFFGVDGPYAQLYGVNSMVFSAGLTIGPLVAGVLKDSIGYGNMNAIVAGICAVTSVLSVLFIGGKVKWVGRGRGWKGVGIERRRV